MLRQVGALLLVLAVVGCAEDDSPRGSRPVSAEQPREGAAAQLEELQAQQRDWQQSIQTLTDEAKALVARQDELLKAVAAAKTADERTVARDRLVELKKNMLEKRKQLRLMMQRRP